jgi:hypothetical protein
MISEEDWVDGLGVNIREIWLASRHILGEELGDDK